MSENIQSISIGTYTIGSTSATNFVAGTGIKIDEPSAGTVRIGNDETVLWSGSPSGEITLSEPCTNFDKLEFTTTNNEIITVKVAEGNYSLIFTPAPNTNYGFFSFVVFTLSGSNISTIIGQVLNAGPFSNASPAMTWDKSSGFKNWCVRVVGINRISGSNA